MPKNIKGGKGHKKGKNSVNPDRDKLLLKEGVDQNYGLITKCLGDLRFRLVDPNSQEYLGRLRGKMKGRQRIRVGDIVLICYRETREPKVDIIHKYNEAQAKQIIRIEKIEFPDGDHPFSSQSQQILFEDGPSDVPADFQKQSGSDRIASIYAATHSSDDDDDDEYDEEDEENSDDHNSSVDQASESSQEPDECVKVDKRHKVDHRADYKQRQKTTAAAAILLSDEAVNIDSI